MRLRRRIENLEEITINDDIMFSLVMQDKEICRGLLELLLDVKIEGEVTVISQLTKKASYVSKGVRFDVVLKNVDTIYNLEMQNKERDDFSARLIYYSAMITQESLQMGNYYKDRHKTIIIFLCTHDPFKDGLGHYTVNWRINESNNALLSDASTIHVFNTKSTKGVSSNVVEFFQYINGKTIELTELMKQINVSRKKQIAGGMYVEAFNKIYGFWGDANQEGREQGIQEGIQKGIQEGMKRHIKSLKEINIPEDDKIKIIVEYYDKTYEEAKELIEVIN